MNGLSGRSWERVKRIVRLFLKFLSNPSPPERKYSTYLIPLSFYFKLIFLLFLSGANFEGLRRAQERDPRPRYEDMKRRVVLWE